MKVLIIDDDPGNRRLATRMLARLPKVTILEADGGKAGLAVSEAHPVDVFLLDISMPDMDGIEVCSRLRATPIYATATIIACTAHAGTRDHEDFIIRGFTSVLTKPFLLDELYSALNFNAPTC